MEKVIKISKIIIFFFMQTMLGVLTTFVSNIVAIEINEYKKGELMLFSIILAVLIVADIFSLLISPSIIVSAIIIIFSIIGTFVILKKYPV